MSESGPGGFFPPTQLLSPTPSTASSRSNALLPHPRPRSLRPGSNKEDTVRRFVEERLATVSRRYVKKHGRPQPGDDEVVGYTSFVELCKDLHSIIDVLWRSGTPSLQIPFLLNIASELTKYVESFPAAPRATFAILRKLDHCFASLLLGQDVETEEPLPGFENGLRAGMSTTDMVRCRSSVEETRVVMVDILNSAEEDEDGEDEDDDDEEEDSDTDMDMATNQPIDPARWTEDDDRLDMDVARVYEKTLVQLGNRLGDSLGVRTGTDDTCLAPDQ